MSKRKKIRKGKSRKKTKDIRLNTKSSYNVLHEHNYFHIINKKGRWFNNTEIIANDDDKCDSMPNCCIANSTSDEEDDTTLMPLSHVLKKEFKKDLLHAVRFC